MGYSVFIRDNASGEIREHYEDCDWNYDPSESHTEFLWSEGNYSCDCNRGMFFAEAGNQSSSFFGHECGHTKFTVVKIVDDEGTIVYSEGSSYD